MRYTARNLKTYKLNNFEIRFAPERDVRSAALLTRSRIRDRVACSLGRFTSAASRRTVCDCRQGELEAGATWHIRARP
jgi:hypothetical protein